MGGLELRNAVKLFHGRRIVATREIGAAEA